VTASRPPVGATDGVGRGVAAADERLEAFIDPANPSRGIAERLEACASASASSWWWTGWWDLIRQHYGNEPLVVVLGAFADTLRAGADPIELVEGHAAEAAIQTAQSWLAANIKPVDVRRWLAAACTRAGVAQDLARAGVRPGHLLTRDGLPRSIGDLTSGRSVPLAAAVANGVLPVEKAAACIKQIARNYTVQVSWQGRWWRVDIEDVAVTQVWRLAEVMDTAYDLVERSQPQGVLWLNAEVRLPAAVRGCLQLARRYQSEAEQAHSDGGQQAVTRLAEAAQCHAARELVAIGVAPEDVGVVLRVSEARARELAAG
jgi:hypothetical protein